MDFLRFSFFCFFLCTFDFLGVPIGLRYFSKGFKPLTRFFLVSTFFLHKRSQDCLLATKRPMMPHLLGNWKNLYTILFCVFRNKNTDNNHTG